MGLQVRHVRPEPFLTRVPLGLGLVPAAPASAGAGPAAGGGGCGDLVPGGDAVVLDAVQVLLELLALGLGDLALGGGVLVDVDLGAAVGGDGGAPAVVVGGEAHRVGGVDLAAAGQHVAELAAAVGDAPPPRRPRVGCGRPHHGLPVGLPDSSCAGGLDGLARGPGGRRGADALGDPVLDAGRPLGVQGGGDLPYDVVGLEARAQDVHAPAGEDLRPVLTELGGHVRRQGLVGGDDLDGVGQPLGAGGVEPVEVEQVPGDVHLPVELGQQLGQGLLVAGLHQVSGQARRGPVEAHCAPPPRRRRAVAGRRARPGRTAWGPRRGGRGWP